MAYPLTDVLADPQRAARDLEHDGIVYGVRAACGRTTEHGAAVLEMTLEPQPGLRAEGYLPERIRIVVRGQAGWSDAASPATVLGR